MKKLTNRIDSGHGYKTKGKRSPDNRILEYKYCREMATELTELLSNEYKVINLMQNILYDESLSSRCKRINKLIKGNTIVISLHLNAAGNGKQWYDANGWSVFVSTNASSKSKILASNLAESALAYDLKVRKPLPTQNYWIKNLAICRDTKCPAVLVENMFMDNKEDVEFLLSNEGKHTLINTIIDGIDRYYKQI